MVSPAHFGFEEHNQHGRAIMLRRIRPAFKCHGGKYYLSRWIISQFPERYSDLSYVEPFCGGASVLPNTTARN